MRHLKRIEIAFDIGVSVGSRRRSRGLKFRIEQFERSLDRHSGMQNAAFEADHCLEIPVQLDNPGAAGALVQAINILRHQSLRSPSRFEAGQRIVGNVRPGVRDRWPTDHAPRPVASARRLRIQKVLQENRRRAPPLAICVAIAGNARIGADSRPGQDEQPRMLLDEADEVGQGVAVSRKQLRVHRIGLRVGLLFNEWRSDHRSFRASCCVPATPEARRDSGPARLRRDRKRTGRKSPGSSLLYLAGSGRREADRQAKVQARRTRLAHTSLRKFTPRTPVPAR